MQTPRVVKMAPCKTLIRLADGADSESGALAEPFVPSEGAEALTAESVVAISIVLRKGVRIKRQPALCLGNAVERVTHQGP